MKQYNVSMQRKNGWVTMSDDPNHHFPVKTIEEVAEEFRLYGGADPYDEYMVDSDGYLLKTPEEIFALLIYTGGGLGENGMKLEDVPDKYDKAKVIELIELRRQGKHPEGAERWGDRAVKR